MKSAPNICTPIRCLSQAAAAAAAACVIALICNVDPSVLSPVDSPNIFRCGIESRKYPYARGEFRAILAAQLNLPRPSGKIQWNLRTDKVPFQTI